MEAANDAQNVR